MTVCLPADSDQFIVLDQGVPFCNKHYLNDRIGNNQALPRHEEQTVTFIYARYLFGLKGRKVI